MFTNMRIPAATALAVLALATGCGGEGTTSAGTGTSGGSTSAPVTSVTSATSAPASAAVNDADVMFAQMMIPHHQQAVEMAELAETRAADPEVKELAAKIKAAQDPEIQTMQGWLTAWAKPMPSEGMEHDMGHGMPGIMSADDMKKLQGAKGAAFDRRFAELMIEHHEGAIEMARTEQAQGSNPEAKTLARTIETAQQAEVAQLRKILERL